MQFTFDHYLKERFVIDKPIRLIEIFAGIGSQAKALERLGVDFEHYRACEHDKFAMQSYNAIHGTSFEVSDICDWSGDDLGVVDTDKYIYILTYSFPCQDLSLAGKRKGMSKGDNTRSGLLWEVERLLSETKKLPQVLLMENVTEVHGAANIEDFKDWLLFLESKGYGNYCQDLNAKNYGIPQNRNRCFMVSLLGGFYYTFPEPIKLNERMKDRLEDSVDEKYYLDDSQVSSLLNSDYTSHRNRIQRGGGSVEPSALATIKVRCVSNTIRAGGRGSLDRHMWDVIAVE